MEDGTRVVHAGLPARQHEPLLPGPQFASLYHLSGEPTGDPLEYGRYGNPTWTRWEAALGELEGGHGGRVRVGDGRGGGGADAAAVGGGRAAAA